MKKKLKYVYLILGLIILFGVNTSLRKPYNSSILYQIKSIGDEYGTMRFYNENNKLVVYFDNPGYGISYENLIWDIKINGKTVYSFSETMVTDDVAREINAKAFNISNKNVKIKRRGY